MKKPLLILLFSFIIHFSLFITNCSAQWVRQNYPTQKQVNSIYFLDTLHGWMCAGSTFAIDSGMIFYTSDGGNDWIKQYGADSTQLFKIRFANLNTGYCVGGVNKILKTTNSGTNWFNVYSGPTNGFSDIALINSDTFYVCYKASDLGIFKSTNGGSTLTLLTNGFGDPAFTNLFFTNYTTGWVVANFINLRKTTNAGVNWTTIGNFSNNSINDIFFIDIHTGWLTYTSAVGGNNNLAKTTSGGNNWTLLDTGYTTPVLSIQYDFLFFINSQVGWCLGGSRFTGTNTKFMILKTTNGGLNWGYQDLSDTSCGNHIFFTDTLHGWAYGCSSHGNYTLNGGGQIQVVGIISHSIPARYELSQNYPNPFNPSTTVKFKIKNNSYVKFEVYNILGKEITHWQSDGILSQGEYLVEFNADKLNLSSGIYFYKLIVTDIHEHLAFTNTKKMALIK